MGDCTHADGFTNVTAVDPEPGRKPTVFEGNCLGCGEARYLDTTGTIYRTEEDARHGHNPERRRFAS